MVLRVTDMKGSRPQYKRQQKTTSKVGPQTGEAGHKTNVREWPKKGDTRL